LDIAQLALQEAIVVIATVMGVFLFKGRKDDDSSRPVAGQSG